jgi:hypothetical protein
VNPLAVVISAVIGYAIGTVQVLALDWARRRTQHRTQLRLLKAELRRLAEFTVGYAWSKATGPPSDTLPKPPQPSPNFVALVGSLDFYLTDEHEDDNTQLGLLNILDGCDVLGYCAGQVRKLVDDISTAQGPVAVKLWHRAVEYAEEYDLELARFQTIVSSAVADVERRLREVSLFRQMRRPIGALPKGVNPAPLVRGDPRIGKGAA